MTEMANAKPIPSMLDKDVIIHINRWLREERIGVKGTNTFFAVGTACVRTTTKKSKRGHNYIDITVYPTYPTTETLQERSRGLKPKSLSGLYLPSELIGNEFEIEVWAPKPSWAIKQRDEIGTLVLDVSLVDGLVNKCLPLNDSPYPKRLRVGDPLGEVLRVVLEAYRTKYQPVN